MRLSSFLRLSPLLLLGCGSDDSSSDAPKCGAAFEAGRSEGHTDPFGARAAAQARAGRWSEAESIVQPAHGQNPIEVGDYVLVNEHVAVTIEAPGLSDGYNRFGGDIIAADRVAADGRPLGVSLYGETLFALSNEALDAAAVGVIADGSDGKAAIVRAVGKLKPIPFLASGLASFFKNQYGLDAAIDYVLEPGAEVVKLRLGLRNEGEVALDATLSGAAITDEMFGFFHSSKMQRVTAENGFALPEGFTSFAGFVSEQSSFAVRAASGPLAYAITVSGYDHFTGRGFGVAACSSEFRDYAELVIGQPELDGLRETLRRVDALPPPRTVSGKLTDAGGIAVSGAYVHLLDEDAKYHSRARTDDEGRFALHAPAEQSVLLVPELRGYPTHEGTAVAADEDDVELSFGPHGVIRVTATDADSGQGLPVRIQVIPAEPLAPAPDEHGVASELDGRLHQEFAMNGSAELVVPPGAHRVVVSRGFEWELADESVEVAAGQTVEIEPALQRTVDTSGYLCADFHLHTELSVDATDPMPYKVRGAVADGLDILVSSEHEWVADFAPVIAELGLSEWAFGMPSEELTTFEWGHFGVVPLYPRPGELNNGAVEWVGSLPPAILGGLRELPEAPVVVVNHPSMSSFLGYFSAAKFDRASGEGDSELWTESFDALEVFNGSSFEQNRDTNVADWFALLAHGSTFWATGASDSHELSTIPAGYPRTCLYFGHDDPTLLTPELVRDALARGEATVSGGLYMTVAGPDGERPGSTIESDASAVEFTVTVAAPSFVDATTLEVLVDGQSVATEPLARIGDGPGQLFVNTISVPLDLTRARNFVVFHAKGERDLTPLHPGRDPFAVSNPIFLTRP